MVIAVIFILLGLVAGAVGALVGLGGGVFITPGLIFLGKTFPELSRISPQVAVGTSLAVIIFSSAGSTLSYARQGRVDFSSGLLFFVASGPGVIAGTLLNQGMNEAVFHLLFGTILCLIFYMLIKNRSMRAQNIRWHVTKFFFDEYGDYYEYGYHYFVVVVLCFFVGLLQGMFGIGGGALLVPAMLLLFWFPAHIATATSMFVIFLSSILGSVSQAFLGNIDWAILLWLAPGAWLGGQAGAMIARRINSQGLVLLLRGMILVLALHALWEGMRVLLK